MSDIDRVLAWFADRSLVRPDATQPSTVHLSRAIVSIAGAAELEMDAPVRRIADAIGDSDHYVLALVDGLGMNLIETLASDSFFRTHLSMELQATFPSSTAPALTTLFTGCWPATHAVTGWWMYLPHARLTSTILPFVERFSGLPLGDFGVTSQDAFMAPSTMPQLRNAASWMPSAIADSVSSRYFRSGTPVFGYEHLSDACTAIARGMAASRERSYTYLYVPHVDNAEHEHGPMSKAVRKSVDDTQALLQGLAEMIGASGRLIITADHGQLDVPLSRQQILGEDDPLIQMLIVPPTGDYRAPLFHVRAGQLEHFIAAFTERFGERWALLTADQVQDLRLLGPEMLAVETRRRWGDFVAMGAHQDAMRYAPTEPMLGYHGGLRPEEMRIPLIVA